MTFVEGNAGRRVFCVNITLLKTLSLFVRKIMKTVTLTDLRRNLEAYLAEARTGDIVITRYGKEVARLIATNETATQGGGVQGDVGTSNGHSAVNGAASVA